MIKISFSSELKENIYNSLLKKNCCKRSLFYAFMATKGSLHNDGIRIYANNDTEADYISRALLELFNRELVHKKRIKGRRGYELFFFCDPAVKYIADLDCESLMSQCKCEACRTSFLRGIFLASGRMSDPDKAFHLEFSLGERAKMFIPMFSQIEMTPKYTERKNERIIYFKNSNEICDFLAAIDEGQLAMDLINYGIRNQYKNYANRRANIESSNILRSVEVGLKQVEAITKLKESGQLALLPDELRITAEMRLEHSDISLSALGSMLSPPISKSGVNHRLQKIIAFAEGIDTD